MIQRIKVHPAERDISSIHKPKQRHQIRYLPNLFDRLSNDYRFQDTESALSISHSQKDYKNSVLRDLNYLLNTLNFSSQFDIEQYPEVCSSTVNYGMPPIAGCFLTETRVIQIEGIIRDAILRFEPRIMPISLFVSSALGEKQTVTNNIIPFQIGGQLWMEPYPLDFLVQTMMDIETNRVELIE
jgi:type VI secretion system protein ImpF